MELFITNNCQIFIKLYVMQLQSLQYQEVKVKLSRYRPGVAQRVPGKLRFPDFMTTAQDGGKVVSLTHRPPLPS
jgi:hypothetical protein